MIDPTYLNELVEEALVREEAFLVALEMKAGDRIELLVDHMDGLTLEKITSISKHIRHGLDEREYDYALEVSSPGVGEPLSVEQQYVKNVGRDVQVITRENEKIKGLLTAFENGMLTLEYSVREPKEVGKGKVTVVKNREIALSDIQSTKVLIKF
jgi:ribosome maturation factor RimP